jgi:ABC-type glycerol-3-phosphate transport system substrate-binding protein
MKAKRLLSLFAAVLMLLSTLLLASCNNNEEESKDNSAEVKGDSLEDVVTMPEYRWADDENYKQFDVLVYSQEVQATYFSEDVEAGLYANTDQALTEAVTKRNNEIFTKYGVTVKAVPVADVTNELMTTVLGGDSLYDAAMPFMPGAARLAQENCLYDLNEFGDYLHLDKEWWDQSANKALSIGGKLYFTTGDISIMPKIVSFAMTFNKTMLGKYFADTDLYQIVRDGKWTMDKLMEMSRKVTADSDGTTGMTYQDTWGLSSSFNDAAAFYIASGYNYVSKDANDLPIVTFDQEASITQAKKILENLQIKDEWIFHCNTAGTPDVWVTSLDTFGQNRALFRTSAFSAMKKLRMYDDVDDYGIVPIPKATEKQDKYYTYCNAQYAYSIVIPNSLSQEDAEWSAYMIEAMAYGGRKYITPAYYETTLKSRDLRDEDSEEMLDDYVFANIVYDLGVIYDFGGITSMIGTLMSTNSTNVNSSFEQIEDTIADDIQTCIEAYGLD